MFRILFIFCVLTNLVFSQTINPDHKLLWEISGKNLSQKSYLYGSFHSNDKRLFQLTDSTYFAMNVAEAIVLETDIFSMFDQWDTRKGSISTLYDNQGNPYTASKEAGNTVYGNEDGMPQFLDAYFLNYAHNADKKFFALESVDKQLKLSERKIKPEIEKFSSNTFLINQEKMLETYQKGDIYSLEKMLKVNLATSPGLFEDLIENRNVEMFQGLDTLMKKFAVFCAVGAGHLAGEKGLINLMRKKGYTIRPVMASYSNEPTETKQIVQSYREYVYVNDTVGITAIFPGKPLETKIWDNHPYLIYREMGQGNTYSIEVVPVQEGLSLNDHASIYISSPNQTQFKQIVLDDGTEVYEGLSDTYEEGLHWMRLMQNNQYLIIMKAYGGNKFMHSNRPKMFFSKVFFEY